ncbi:MAG: Bax inhibitor-1 family protein [Lachnospiraceae bacterium]|nr:Bax inhibitor-1 family protein [Lachnospiraceae bacterium]
MEIGEYRYKKTELLKLSEEIYQYKGRKQQLEFELSSEQFHRKYIPKRKEILRHRMMLNRPILIVAGFVFIMCLVAIIDYVLTRPSYSELSELSVYEAQKLGADGVVLLGATLLAAFMIRVLYALFKEQNSMKIKLKKSSDSDKAIRYAKEKDVDTLQADDIKNKQRIEELVAEIEELDKKIEELENVRYELIKEAKKKNTYDETWELTANKEKPTNAAGLNLKENFDDVFDIRELFAYYTTAENYVIKNLDDLKLRLTQTNKSITKVNDDFERSKMVVFAYIIFIIVAGFLQIFLKDPVLTIYAVVRFIVAFAGLIFVDRYIKNPILFYLVENESSFVDEYVFVNDIVPYKIQRQNLIELIDDSEKELNDIRKKKRELDNN